MSVVLDSRIHAKAVHAAVTAQLQPRWQSYDFGKVPGADGIPGRLPDIYVLIAVERRFNPNLRLSAQASSVGWRISARVVGKTVDEARWALARVADALNEKRLAITIDAGTRKTTPIQFEAEQSPALDGGHQSALSTWTYAL